jgi:hypothetical protein
VPAPKPAIQASAAPTSIATAPVPAPAAKADEAKSEVATRSLGTRRPAETTGQATAPVEPVRAAAPVPSAPPERPAATPSEPSTQAAASDGEAKPDRPRRRAKRAARSRASARAERRSREDREPREFVDQYGRRHVVLPRRSREDDRRALAQQPPSYNRPPGMIFGSPPSDPRY